MRVAHVETENTTDVADMRRELLLCLDIVKRLVVQLTLELEHSLDHRVTKISSLVILSEFVSQLPF